MRGGKKGVRYTADGWGKSADGMVTDPCRHVVEDGTECGNATPPGLEALDGRCGSEATFPRYGARDSFQTMSIPTHSLLSTSSRAGGTFFLVLLCVLFVLPVPIQAQIQPPVAGVVDVGLLLRQLDGEKRVLMIAAHPDDEDTSLLAAMARGEGARTAYLSLSRGEGGQNLIGPELGEGLGIIRTGELLSARSLDGAEQYFTRAFDFGFSKSAEETFDHWPRGELLRDVIWVIRNFRPHVVVSVFTGTPRDGHGHHQVAGMVALEAFRAAGDAHQFPDQLQEGVEPWRPLKFYRSTRFRPVETTVEIPTGTLDPLLGRSYFQVAMESRSRHRSQDMGAPRTPGPRSSGVELVEDRTGEGLAGPWVQGNDSGSVGLASGEMGREVRDLEPGLFAGIDTTLVGLARAALAEGGGAAREPDALIQDLEAYRKSIQRARSQLLAERPNETIPELLSARTQLLRALDRVQEWKAEGVQTGGAQREFIRVIEAREATLSKAILAGSGVIAELRVDRSRVVPGEDLEAQLLIWNGGTREVEIHDLGLELPDEWAMEVAPELAAQGTGGIQGFFALDPATLSDRRPSQASPHRLPPGEMVRWAYRLRVPTSQSPSRLYYLADDRDGSLYTWPSDSGLHGLPVDPPLVSGWAELRVSGNDPIQWTGPGHHVEVDKALGEYREPLVVVPALSVEVAPASMAWPSEADGPRTATVRVTNHASLPLEGQVGLDAPAGWRVEPGSRPFRSGAGGGEVVHTFQIQPADASAAEAGAGESHGSMAGVGAQVTFRGWAQVNRDGSPARYEEGFDFIDYPHLDPAPLYRDAALNLSAFPVAVESELRVGYIQGPGDDGPRALRDMGVHVELLGPDAYRTEDLSRFHTLVLGIRAYETREDLWVANERLLEFAREGGTVVVKYNKYEYPDGEFAPYPLAMRRPHHRVTDPDAPVRLLDPDHPLLSQPNRIGPSDFQGWQQERGLYFLSDWDPRYTPLLEMADPGEEPNQGSLVVAQVGEGAYIYTGLALFRQFSAGVPGAFRLLANMVSLKGSDLADAASGDDG